MISKIITIASTIDELNDKLNYLSEKYLNNPWAGMVIFMALLIFGWWAVSSFGKN